MKKEINKTEDDWLTEEDIHCFVFAYCAMGIGILLVGLLLALIQDLTGINAVVPFTFVAKLIREEERYRDLLFISSLVPPFILLFVLRFAGLRWRFIGYVRRWFEDYRA